MLKKSPALIIHNGSTQLFYCSKHMKGLQTSPVATRERDGLIRGTVLCAVLTDFSLTHPSGSYCAPSPLG